MSGLIVAIGGGGFDSANPSPHMDEWFLKLTGTARPRLTLIPTATADSPDRIGRFIEAAQYLGIDPFVLSLYWPESRDDLKRAMEADAIFVTGGNTFNMIGLWRLWGLDHLLWEAHQNGVLLGGVSAGANCWFEQCSTDSFGRALEVIPGLGWIPGSFCPHYHGEAERRPTLAGFLDSGELKPGWAADDLAALVISPNGAKSTFSFAQGAEVYQVSVQEGVFIENPLPGSRIKP